MSILDKRVCEEDINRVNAVRHHPKYEPGFEKECREERVWYMRGENGLPVGYFMFEDVQEQFDRWQAKKNGGAIGNGNGQNGVGVGQSSVGESRTVESGAKASGAKASGAKASGVNKEHQEKKESLFDKITNWLMKYAGIE